VVVKPVFPQYRHRTRAVFDIPGPGFQLGGWPEFCDTLWPVLSTRFAPIYSETEQKIGGCFQILCVMSMSSCCLELFFSAIAAIFVAMVVFWTYRRNYRASMSQIQLICPFLIMGGPA
jgi:hypothetical protein